MGDYFLKYLREWIGRFKGVGKTRKKNSVFIAIILMLAMGIFFCTIVENYAYADKSTDGYSQFSSFKPEYVQSISDLRNIDLNWEVVAPDNSCKTKPADEDSKEEVAASAEKKSVGIKIYPLEDVVRENMKSIKELVGEKDASQENNEDSSLSSQQDGVENKENGQKEGRILELVAGYPIEEMLPYIAVRDERVAYYLVAIAKKESDWGKHSPLKYGSTCYNYWGYRGTYNQTDSGYSCFDSPEQAIQQVGDRIEALLDKSIDTPEEMIVWKCGSTCAGHDPQGVLKWISDVKLYYRKLST